jgi:arsenate reductase
MTIIYGIPNCASVQKARQWLAAQGIDATFHDFKKQGVTPALLEHWIAGSELSLVLNRKGTTWRKLSQSERNTADTCAGAIALMVQHSSLIKRPVLEHAGHILLGFNEVAYQEVFGR